MWNKTTATAVLGIELPIVQGPFGGGNSSQELAAAVSNAGALGSYGAVGLWPAEIRKLSRGLSLRTKKPFNLNLWLPIAGEDDRAVKATERARMLGLLRPFLDELGLDDPPVATAPTFAEQVDAVLEARPPVWSFVMGIPDRAMLRAARQRGIKTIGTATTVEEAVAIAEAGADAVVASGSDAGGHRGSFLRPAEQSLTGTFSLVPQVAKAVGIPTIAAGGIADGRGIVAALALGAGAAQLGSAFLATHESGAPAAHKAALCSGDARFTRLTRAFTGRLARGVENRLMRALEAHAGELLPYPAQHHLTLSLRRFAAQRARSDLMSLWAGQNTAGLSSLPAAALVEQLVREVESALRSDHLVPRQP